MLKDAISLGFSRRRGFSSFRLTLAWITYSILNTLQEVSTVGQEDAAGIGSFRLNDLVKLVGPEISILEVVSDIILGPNTSFLIHHYVSFHIRKANLTYLFFP